MFGEVMFNWIILAVEVKTKLFHFKSKLLVQQYSRIIYRAVESDILAHTSLYQVIKHKGCNACPLKVRVNEKKRYVRFTWLDIWSQESTPNYKMAVQSHNSKVGILSALSYIYTWPEMFLNEVIDYRHVVLLKITVLYRLLEIIKIHICSRMNEAFLLLL